LRLLFSFTDGLYAVPDRFSFVSSEGVAELILIRCTLTPINQHFDTSVEKLLYCLTFLGVKRKIKSLPPVKTWQRICPPNGGESGEGIVDGEKLERPKRVIYGCKFKNLIQVEVVLCLFILSGTHNGFLIRPDRNDLGKTTSRNGRVTLAAVGSRNRVELEVRN
jgi:hypothetical protein